MSATSTALLIAALAFSVQRAKLTGAPPLMVLPVATTLFGHLLFALTVPTRRWRFLRAAARFALVMGFFTLFVVPNVVSFLGMAEVAVPHARLGAVRKDASATEIAVALALGTSPTTTSRPLSDAQVLQTVSVASVWGPLFRLGIKDASDVADTGFSSFRPNTEPSAANKLSHHFALGSKRKVQGKLHTIHTFLDVPTSVQATVDLAQPSSFPAQLCGRFYDGAPSFASEERITARFANARGVVFRAEPCPEATAWWQGRQPMVLCVVFVGYLALVLAATVVYLGFVVDPDQLQGEVGLVVTALRFSSNASPKSVVDFYQLQLELDDLDRLVAIAHEVGGKKNKPPKDPFAVRGREQGSQGGGQRRAWQVDAPLVQLLGSLSDQQCATVAAKLWREFQGTDGADGQEGGNEQEGGDKDLCEAVRELAALCKGADDGKVEFEVTWGEQE